MLERVLESLLSNWGCVSDLGGFRKQGFAVRKWGYVHDWHLSESYPERGQPRGRLKLSLVKKQWSLLFIRREDV